MKGIYLDYAAHTPLSNTSRKAVERVLKAESANNQSVHERGRSVAKQIQECIANIKDCVQATNDHKVYFSGGGTATNREVLGACSKNTARNVFAYSTIEHSSVIEFAQVIEREGWKTVELPVTNFGTLDIESALTICVQEGVGLVSIMMVNNEIGTVQPVSRFLKELGRMIPDVVTHTDASQAPLYESIDIQRLNVDALTMCGQKIYGPQGIGVSVVTKRIFEHMPTSGTLPHALIAGFSVALRDAVQNREGYIQKLSMLKEFLYKTLKQKNVDYVINGTDPLPLAINLSFPKIQYDSEYLVSYLNTKGIYLSSRSACLGSSEQNSRVLERINARGGNALRISLGNRTTKKDITVLVDVLSSLQNK